jgi:hypothetical protein
MLKKIRKSFESESVLYTRHAKEEMDLEEFGEIKEHEVCEAVMNGKVIEDYPDDEPYPSCLIYGITQTGRPLHVVSAYAEDEQRSIIITVYHPDPDRWIGFERRRS